MKNKHLSLSERLDIEKYLNERKSSKQIGLLLDKDCTTISKEIKNHIVYKNTGAIGRPFLNCAHRRNCSFREKGIRCNQQACEHYEKEDCHLLSKPPYVCNGCPNKSHCTLSKKFYDGVYANNEYKNTLRESREGINFTPLEIQTLNEILKPLIVEQKQSIYHACVSNKNKIMCSEREIYNLIDKGFLEIKNIDLPRKVRYRSRPKRKTYYKIDKKCLEGRRYKDYLLFIEENPDIPIVQMDSVEGVKGGKVLLTIHFVNCSFMISFLRENNNAQSVIDTFNKLEELFGLELFKKLFPVILTDNGSEFSNPKEIEYSPITGEKRTRIFYCEPERSDQKGACEVNHEFIRRVLPQGTPFDNLEQKDIELLMSNINSYKRKKLNDCSPIQLFSLLYGNDIADKLGIIEIDSNDINLSERLLKKN